MRSMGVRELPEEPRFSDPGLADHGDDLSLPRLRLLQGGERVSISTSRPTKVVKPLAAAACRRERTGLAPVNSKISVGVASSLTATSPSDCTWTKPCARRSVSAVSSVALDIVGRRGPLVAELLLQEPRVRNGPRIPWLPRKRHGDGPLEPVPAASLCDPNRSRTHTRQRRPT